MFHKAGKSTTPNYQWYQEHRIQLPSQMDQPITKIKNKNNKKKKKKKKEKNNHCQEVIFTRKDSNKSNEL